MRSCSALPTSDGEHPSLHVQDSRPSDSGQFNGLSSNSLHTRRSVWPVLAIGRTDHAGFSITSYSRPDLIASFYSSSVSLRRSINAGAVACPDDRSGLWHTSHVEYNELRRRVYKLRVHLQGAGLNTHLECAMTFLVVREAGHDPAQRARYLDGAINSLMSLPPSCATWTAVETPESFAECCSVVSSAYAP